MKRSLAFTVIPALLAIAISACSQPQDLKTPELEAQFGGAGYDSADAVSVAKSGVVTVGSNLAALPDSQGYVLNDVQLRQFDTSGRVLRQVSVSKARCTETGLECIHQKFLDIKNDSQGNVYALTTASADRMDIPLKILTIYKYNSTLQTLLWKKEIRDVDYWPESSLGLDNSGNVYVGYTPVIVRDEGIGDASPGVPRFIRYSTNGVKWYQRNSKVGAINDLTVASNGDIYIVGDKGLSRYNNGGGLIWTKTVLGSAVAATGTHSYVLRNENIYKTDLQGRSTLLEVVGTMTTSSEIETDTKGNVYVGGHEQYSLDDIEEKYRGFVKKFDANGKNVWTTTIQLAEQFDLHDVRTYDGGSVYTVGSTSDPVNGSNRGGSDAFVTRLDAQGNQVWER